MDGPDKEDITVSDYKKFKKEIELLRVENEILKNDPHIHKRQIETKISFIKKYKNKYYIYLMCNILKISRSSYYNHLNKVKSKSKFIKEFIQDKILEIYYDSKKI